MLLVRFPLLPLRGSVVVVSLTLNRQRCLRCHTQLSVLTSTRCPLRKWGRAAMPILGSLFSRIPSVKHRMWWSVLLFSPKYRLGNPKIIYFHYLEKIYFLDQSIQKIFFIILKIEALVVVCKCVCFWLWLCSVSRNSPYVMNGTNNNQIMHGCIYGGIVFLMCFGEHTHQVDCVGFTLLSNEEKRFRRKTFGLACVIW